MRLRTFLCLTALIAPLVAACEREEAAETEPAKLVVAVLPDQNEKALIARYTPLLKYVSKEVGIPCQLLTPKSYEELLDMFVTEQVNVAYFGGLTFLKARKAKAVIPLVMRDIDVKFTSYFLVRADSPAKDVADFKGKILSFGSRLSTSGHLMPRVYLEERGIAPSSFFGEVLYSGAHDETVYAVRDGRADLGAANAHVIRSMYRDGRLDRKDVRILSETPPYPDYVWAVAPSMSPALRRRIRDAFLNLSPVDEAHRRILERVTARAFLPARIDDFAPLGKMAEELRLLDERG